MTTNITSNSSTTPLLANGTFFGFWTPVSTYSAVNVLASSNVAGEVSIQFSTTRTSVDFEVSIAVAGGEAQTLSQTILAPYFRVKYANDIVNQTTFLLWTTLSTAYPTEVAVAVDLDANTSSVAVYGQKPDTTLSALQLDVSGNLKTTATLSLDGTLNVSDASSHELLIDLSAAIYEQTNSLLYDLDIIANHGNDASANALATITAIETQTTDLSNALTAVVDGLKDISGTVSVSNTLLSVVDVSSVALLETLNEAVGNIELNTTILGVQPLHLSLTENGTSVWADGYPWIVPATGEDGWAYINEYGVTGTQLYYYANAPALVPLSIEPNITLGSVECGWFIGNQKLLTDPDNRFIMNIYTQPTGVDDFAFWYHSRRAYQVSSSVVLSKGVDYFFYWGVDPTLLHPEYKHIELSLAISEGDLLPEEVVEFMSVNVPTIPPINEFYGVVKQAGFVGANTIRNVYFDNDVSFKAQTQVGLLDFSGTELLVRDASAIALLADIANGITVEVGEVDISGVSVVDGKLSVLDVSANLELLTIREILADIVPVANYGLLNDTPTYLPIRVDASGAMLVSVNNSQTVVEISGGVVADLSGSSFTDGKLNVFDSSSNEHLFAIEDILETGFINVYDASSELVLEAIKTQTDLLTFSSKDGLNALLVKVDNQLTTPFSVTETNPITSVFAKLKDADDVALTSSATESNGNVLNTRLFGYDIANDLVRPVRQGENGGLFVENITSVDFEVVVKQSVPIEISGNVVVNDLSVNILNSSLDVNCFGSSDGTTFHHLKTTATGELVTHSQTRDGAGNAIDSTDFGTYRALNVNVSNSAIPVSNTNANALYSRALDVSNVQVANNVTVTGPVRVGSSDADTQGYTYISAIMSFTSVTTGGTIYLEVSHDANLFARPSGASTFVMLSGASVTASILLSSPVPFRYARLWADTGFVGLGCSAWICMK